MSVDWDGIDHVTKVDPAKPLPPEPGILAGTDLVMVGGSDGVTEANTLETIETIREHAPETPVCQEPYDSTQVSLASARAVDALTIPAVFNGDRAHFVGKHLAMFATLAAKPADVLGANVPVVGDLIESKGRETVTEVAAKVVGEGYVIQHVESEAARVAGVEEPCTADEVAGAAMAAESFYGFPIFYVEYSGTYGGPEDVSTAADHLEEAALLYGGGIDSAERTREILEAGADAVVVGDCYHDDPAAFRRTIPA